MCNGCPNAGLDFSQFINALWAVLKKMYVTPEIARGKLFNLHLVCIKETLKHTATRGPGKMLNMRPLETRDSETGNAVPAEGEYNENWAVILTEQQLCEPEVVNLVQEFAHPVREIFRRYAILAAEPPPSEKTSDTDKDEKEKEPVRARQTMVYRRKELSDAEKVLREVYTTVKEQVVTWNEYKQFLIDFGFFPEISSWQSAQAQFESTEFRHSTTELPLQGFVEATWRIAFTYLTTYGNVVQKNASCRAKCVWVITFLRRMDLDGSWHIRKEADMDDLGVEDILLSGAFK